MKNLRIQYLLDGFIDNSLSVEEELELFNLLSSAEADEEVREYLPKTFGNPEGQYSLDDAQSQRILSSILEMKTGETKRKSPYFGLGIQWAAAVLIIFAAGISLFYIFTREAKNNSLAIQPHSKEIRNDVLPGSSGAILKLADGSVIALESSINKNPIQQRNATIIKHGGTLSYVANREKNQHAIDYNTLETPRGRQFNVKLEDGTAVWLNAESSIKFPVVFGAKEREVTITGEVYFEVAKNKQRPFRVSVNGIVVEVLGTHFNINSYEDEGSVKTTLLEGSVKVMKKGSQVMLKPGQQAKSDNEGLTIANDVNTNEVVAWKNNFFSFDNSAIKKVMMQISRWYDVVVVVKGKTGDEVSFTGDISRSVNLSNVLKMLEATGEADFTVEDKKVTVIMK